MASRRWGGGLVRRAPAEEHQATGTVPGQPLRVDQTQGAQAAGDQVETVLAEGGAAAVFGQVGAVEAGRHPFTGHVGQLEFVVRLGHFLVDQAGLGQAVVGG